MSMEKDRDHELPLNREGATQSKARHLKQFRVHLPRQLQVRFSLSNLITSVSHLLLERVIEEMCEVDDGAVFNVMQTPSLGVAADRRYAGYAYGEELMRWVEGGTKTQFLGNLVHTTRTNQGLEAGRERLATLRGSFFSTSRRQAAARAIAEELFSDAQRRAGSSIATLQMLLEQAVVQLEGLCEGVSRDVAATETRRNRLQEAVREAGFNAVQRQQEENGEVTEDLGSGGFWSRVRRSLNAASRAVSRVAARLAQFGSSHPEAADWTAPVEAAEAELLACEVRLATRTAEWEVLAGVVKALSFECENNRSLLVLLRARREASAPAAAQAQKTRDYGLAGSELLLNDAALTQAVISDKFMRETEGRSTPPAQFRDLCVREIEQAAGTHDSELITRMFEAVRAEVGKTLRNYTVADAIVALQEHNQYFAARLRAAFESITRANFLAAGYERNLDLQRFASLTYVSPSTREVNSSFRSMLNGVLLDVHVEAQVKAVETEPETLRFCVVDYVPLTVLGLYRDARPVYEHLKDDPRYNIHPELSA